MDPFPSILCASSHQTFWFASVFSPFMAPLGGSLVLSLPAAGKACSLPSPIHLYGHAGGTLLPVLRCLSDFTTECLIAVGKGALLVFSLSFLGSSAWCVQLWGRDKTTVLPLYCAATPSWINLALPREWTLNKPKIIVLHFSKGKTSALFQFKFVA